MTSAVSLVECPRDAFQGLPGFIPTEVKVRHLKNIITAGIGEIDFGSFVSPKAVPQMADTEDVLRRLCEEVAELPKLIAIIANERGLDRAIQARDSIRGSPLAGFAVGYPLSISETFQKNNTGKTIAESWPLVESLQRRSADAGIDLIVYLSMGFGNPYGEPWSPETVADFARRLADLGVRTISLADTVGRANADQVRETFAAVHSALSTQHSALTIGAHFHAAPHAWLDNVRAAFDAGCRRFDASLGGYGGCPFAQDELVGNIPMEHVVAMFEKMGVRMGVSRAALDPALASAREVFDRYGHA